MRASGRDRVGDGFDAREAVFPSTGAAGCACGTFRALGAGGDCEFVAHVTTTRLDPGRRESLQATDRLPMVVMNETPTWMGAALLDGPADGGERSRDSDE
jgi:hypothetical protein